MAVTNQIGFISTRIKELQNAVLHNHSGDILDLPDITVHAIDVDEGGYVWFTILKPCSFKELNKPFSVALDFYRKGFPFYLKISGVASFIESFKIGELPQNLQQHLVTGRVMVCVKIKEVDYYEQELQPTKGWLQKIKKVWDEAFGDETYFPAIPAID